MHYLLPGYALETCVRPIEQLALQRVYKYITKSWICHIIDYHILLGMLDVSYKIIIKVRFSHPTYSAIRSRYADILRGSDNLSVILKKPPRRLSSYVYALLTHRDFMLNVWIPLLRKETYIKNTCIL